MTDTSAPGQRLRQATWDFFVSRAGADSEIAIWIAGLIAAQGAKVLLQDNDFGHQDFMGAMHTGLQDGAPVVALLSPAYLASDHCIKEATTALAGDSLNKRQRLKPLRIDHCAPTGMLATVAYTDLVPERRFNDATALAEKILRAVGFETFTLEGVPPPPAGTLSKKIQIRHPDIRENRTFAGREEMLARLAERMASGGAARNSATAALTNSQRVVDGIAGMGGVGKTVLAREYAWRHRSTYEGVWWINAETEDGILQGLVDLGDLLMPGLANEKDRSKAAHKTLRFIENAGYEAPFLIVYDNVEDLAAFERLTPAAGAHILMTTRQTNLMGIVEDPFDVGVFAPEVATQFLCTYGQRNEPEAALRLAEVLGFLPLAIDHAASYCRGNRLVDFDAYAANVTALIAKKPRDGARAGAYPASVFATLSLALDRVVQGDAERGLPPHPEAETLMSLIAFLAPDAIPLALFGADVMPAIQLGEAVAQLAEVSLLTQVPLEDGAPAVNVHRLVQTVMLARLEQGEAFAANARTALRLVAEAFPNPSDDVRNWPRCVVLEPHATSVLEYEELADSGNVSLLLNQLGIYLMARADYAEAEPLMRRALAIDEASFGPEHPTVAIRLNNLAQLLKATNRLGEAEPLMRRALAIDEASFGPEHPNVARDLNNLALLLKATNRLGEAEPMYRRALAIDEASFGPEHPNVAIRLNNLAQLLKATNRLGEAEPLMRRALAIDEASLGPEHPTVAIRLNNLAELLRATNRLGEAEPMYRRALAIDEASFGPEHPDVAIDLNNLAQLLQDTNRLGEAEPLMQRALAIDEASFGPEHPKVAIRLNNLAQLLQATNRLGEAEPMYRRVVTIFEASLGEDHPNVGAALNNLAQLLQDTNRLGEAEPLMRRALAIDEASFGPEHPDVARDLNNLASLLQATNRLGEAEPLMRRMVGILEKFEQNTGHRHPKYKAALANLADLEAAMAAPSDADKAAPPTPDDAAAATPADDISVQKRSLWDRFRRR